MDQCSSPTSLANIRDQIAANLIALFIWEVGKSLFFRYIWKTNQNDTKNHCNVFTQKLQDIQDDQKALSIQQDKQLNDILSKLNDMQEELQSQNIQADNGPATMSVVPSHVMRSPTQNPEIFDADVNQADFPLTRDSILIQSMMTQIPPGATHLVLHWIFRPRSPPLLSLSPPLGQEVESPETSQPDPQNAVGLGLQPQSLAPPASNVVSSAQPPHTTQESSLRRSGESRGTTTRCNKGSASRSPRDPGDRM